jgi:ABC-type multidrug transport system ATPase subunit
MSAETVLSVEKVEKCYGSNRALRGVDLTVQRGEIVGFLGPNGAGKTTLMKIVMGLERADRGRLTILGQTDGARLHDVRRRIGFLQEKPPIYPEMTAQAYLDFFAGIYAVPDPARRVAAVLDEVGLAAAAHRPLGGFSRGMQQRTCLARVMLHRPEFLILDEPTLGLDPPAVADMRESFRTLKAAGTTLLLSSHQLSEVERLCTSVVFIARGMVVAHGRPQDLLPGESNGMRLLLETREPADAVAAVLAGSDQVEALTPRPDGQLEIVLRSTSVRSPADARAALSQLATSSGFTVLSVALDQPPTLEALFMHLTQDRKPEGTPAATLPQTWRCNMRGGEGDGPWL